MQTRLHYWSTSIAAAAAGFFLAHSGNTPSGLEYHPPTSPLPFVFVFFAHCLSWVALP
jgi:hypothetical protein